MTRVPWITLAGWFGLDISSFANHKSPLWNKREIEQLHKIVENECSSSLVSVDTNNSKDINISIDFEKVANLLYNMTKRYAEPQKNVKLSINQIVLPLPKRKHWNYFGNFTMDMS
jgi:hypothetical protein